MSRAHLLEQVLQNPRIWRPGRGSAPGHQTLASGFETLDQWMGGGWPLGVLTEILLETHGIGELALMMPALARLCPDVLHQDQQHVSEPGVSPSAWSAFVAPPYIPYAPAFASHGIDISRLLVVHPENSAEALWSMEQALRSGLFAAVFGWFSRIDNPALRRLQLAAETSMCWAVMFRPADFISSASPAALRIRLEPDNGATLLHILRNRYGPVGSLSLQC